MSAKAPWVKFYPADFLDGVRGLTHQETGLFVILLCRMYEENGPIEFNVLRLSTYCSMRGSTFEKRVQKLIALGKLTLEEGMLSNTHALAEIADRANALKVASKAGKASAEKSQQKQRKSATGAEHAFNDKDRDKDKDVGGGAYAHEASQPSDQQQRPNEREQILNAMGIGPDGIAGPGVFFGGPGDMAEARRWLELTGLTLPIIVEEIRRIVAAKADGPPKSFRYFTPAMQRLSGQISAAPLQPVGGGQARASPRPPSPEEILARIAAQDAASAEKGLAK